MLHSALSRYGSLATILILSCGTSASLEIAADPALVDLGTTGATTLRVSGMWNGSGFTEGSRPAVELKTDYGTFESPALGGSPVRTFTDGVVLGHAINVELYAPAPPQAGVAHVTATFTAPDGTRAVASIVVEFKPARVVHQLAFSCSSYNIGALRPASTTLQIPCSASITDETGQEVVGQYISFLAEAGTMRYDDAHQNLFYFPTDPNAHHTQPRDVDPLDGSAEPSWTGIDGNVHNPRDGLVTIIAVVWTSKEVAEQEALGEPFVDANDNGRFDDGIGEYPEDYYDLNNNGQWDELQDDSPSAPHALWRKIKVVWSGTLQSEPPIAEVTPTGATLAYGQTPAFTFSLLDQNYNVLAANDPVNDAIFWSVSPEPDITIISAPSVTVQDPNDPRRLGILMDDDFNLLEPSSPSSWRIGGYASVVVQNSMACYMPPQPETFTLQGRLARSLSVTPTGDPQSPASESTLLVSGLLTPGATCPP